MGCVFSKHDNNEKNDNKLGLLDQQKQFINNNEHQVEGSYSSHFLMTNFISDIVNFVFSFRMISEMGHPQDQHNRPQTLHQNTVLQPPVLAASNKILIQNLTTLKI